jgi:hypothetical protein
MKREENTVKTHAYGSFFYNVENDSYEFHARIPCGDHDGKKFESNDQEKKYYQSKMQYMVNAMLSSESPFGELTITENKE